MKEEEEEEEEEEQEGEEETRIGWSCPIKGTFLE